MREIGLIGIAILIMLVSFSTYGQDTRAVLFDKDWRFKKDSLIKAENPAYQDGDWRKLNLPHDWSISVRRNYSVL